jgi:hypothetical protein
MNAGWYRPKEREAEELLPARRGSAQGTACVTGCRSAEGNTMWIQSWRCASAVNTEINVQWLAAVAARSKAVAAEGSKRQRASPQANSSRSELSQRQAMSEQKSAQLTASPGADTEGRRVAVAARGRVAVGEVLDYGAAGRRNRQTRECLEKVK